MMLFVFGDIAEETHRDRHHPISEVELYSRDKVKMLGWSCPHCKDSGFMYRDFVSITCKSCEWHNAPAEVLEFNWIIITGEKNAAS